jgi:hypothetical protein
VGEGVAVGLDDRRQALLGYGKEDVSGLRRADRVEGDADASVRP